MPVCWILSVFQCDAMLVINDKKIMPFAGNKPRTSFESLILFSNEKHAINSRIQSGYAQLSKMNNTLH